MRGSTGFAPTKALDEEGLADGGQRFRFIPLHKRLANASARPAALPTVDYNLNLQNVSPDDTNFSHFSVTLASQKVDNASTSFMNFLKTVQPLSISLPLLYRNRIKIFNASLAALELSSHHSGESTASIAACIAALAKDLGGPNFYLFYPRLCQTIARGLNPQKQSQDVSLVVDIDDDEAESRLDNSTFWQPELMLIPLFSMLSEITKVLVSQLVVHPSDTLSHLQPLLSHHHYRVREMSAESSLGYIIRKTRDDNARQALIISLVNAAKPISTTSTSNDDMKRYADGLGVSLFESIRLPSGCLHSRAKDVLQVAFSQLVPQFEPNAHASANNDITDDLRLETLCRCFANLSKQINAENDVQMMWAFILSVCDKALIEEEWSQLANIFFLMRKWLQFGAHNLVKGLGIPFCQRILNLAVLVVEKRADHTRLSCEVFGSICTLYQFTPITFREKSVAKAFSSALTKSSKGSNSQALLAILKVVLDDRSFSFSPSTLSALTRSISNVCNQLIILQPPASEGNVDGESKLVLQAALRFFRLCSGGSDDADIRSKFNAPAVQTLVLHLLSSSSSTDDVGSNLKKPNILTQALEYLSVVPISDCVDKLESLIKSRRSFSFDDCANYLTACAYPWKVDDEGSSQPGKMADCARIVLQEQLLTSQNAWVVPRVCSSAVRAIHTFGYEILMPVKDRRQTIARRLLSPSELIELVASNLSLDDSKVRSASVPLLIALDRSSTPASIVNSGENEDDVQVYVQVLRGSLTQAVPSFSGLCRAFMYIMNVSRSLSGISSRLIVLQEMSRIVNQMETLSNVLVSMLTHFTLGVFFMPLKPLWQHAGTLLNVIAGHDSQLVMTIALKTLERCKNSVLAEYSNAKDCDKGDEDGEVDGDEDGSDNDEDDVAERSMKSDRAKLCKRNHQGDGNDKESSTPKGSSKRKRRRSNPPMAVSKRQKQKSMESARLHWDTSEWKSHLVHNDSFVIESSNSSKSSAGLREESTDRLTVITEIVRALSKEPKHTINFRSDIIDLYFNLSPGLFPRLKGNSMALSFTTLIDKMGGLKCAQSDRSLENRLRERLLNDLSRNAPQLQSAALQCMCVSRSGSIKQHRDSFLRLIDDKTFREEMTMITEEKFTEWNMSEETKLNDGDEAIIDVLLRICFSKMIGKKASVYSRKSVVMSFVTTKLPWQISLRKMTALILGPIQTGVDELEDNTDDSFVSKVPILVSRVQQGVLTSMETTIKHCRHTLPVDCWKRMVLASLLLLQKSGSGTLGQKMRSKILRLLAQMFNIRPEETTFATMRILSAMESTASGSNGGNNINGAPALLRLMAVMFKNSTPAEIDVVFERHLWIFYYCSRVLRSLECNVSSVDLVCEMLTSKLLTHIKDHSSDSLTKGMNDPLEKVLREISGALCDLFSRLISAMNAERGAQKQWSSAFSKSLKIVEQLIDIDRNLSPYLLNLADELGTFLQSPVLSNVVLRATLKTLSAILAAAAANDGEGSSQRGVSVSQLLPLLSNRRFTQDNESFIALCDLITNIGSNDLQKVVTILKDFNAMSETRLEEADLDTRINALNSVTLLFKNGLGGRDDGRRTDTSMVEFENTVLSADSVVAICHGCISSIYVNDTAIRGTAGYALRLIARWSAFHDAETGRLSRPVVMKTLYESLISVKLLKHRREICVAFGEMVRSVDGTLNNSMDGLELSLKHFHALSSANDLETDFFENAVHLQAHRRGRALRQLEKHFDRVQSSIDESDEILKQSLASFATTFVLPFSLQLAFERPDMDEQKRRKNPTHHMSREDAQKDVSVWAVSLAGVASSVIEWSEYKRCLDNLLRKVSSKNDDEDTTMVYKLLVRVAEAFPKATESRYPNDTIATTYLIEVLFPKMLRLVNVGSINDLLHHEEKAGSMFVQAGNKKDKSQNTFRAPVATALGKLMTHLPNDSLETMMPLLVTPLIAALRSRMISTRDAAKKALTSVTLCLGPKYLHFVLEQVLSSLNEGFRKEMCIYVIQAILQGIKEFRTEQSGDGNSDGNKGVKRFDVDDCVELLVEQIIQELKGGASETRKDFEDPNSSDSRVKLATARAFKAFECAELLGELITFTQSKKSLCVPFLDTATKSISGKLISRVDQLLQRLLIGLCKNTSMTIEDALTFCLEVVCVRDDGLDGENSRDDVKNNIDSDKEHVERKSNTIPIRSKRRKLKTDQAKWVRFGFQLLNSAFAKNSSLINERGNERAKNIYSMCQPFLPLSVAALRSGQDDVVLICLRVLQKLLKLPIPGKDGSVAKDISGIIINVLSQHSGGTSGNGEYDETNDLFNTCLRAAGVLLKEIENDDFLTVSKSRVDGLLNVACRCLESGSTECQSSAITLIRAVVNRKIVLPCVYDSMEQVNRLSIHCSQSTRLRDACLSASVSFLCTFPLAPRRIRQHIEFFVRNINYELASGRIAALLGIGQIIEKFPLKLLSREADYLFVAVAANVARDDDSECREAAFNCLRLLFLRLAGTRKVVDLVRTAYTLAGVHSEANQNHASSKNKKPKEIDDENSGGESDSDLEDDNETEPENQSTLGRWRCDSLENEQDLSVRRCGVVSLYAACKSGKLNKRQTSIILQVVVALFSHLEKTQKMVDSNDWETWYMLLQCFEAVFETSHGAGFQIDISVRPFWLGMKKCLIHRHQWIRLLAARLVGSHLSACGGREVKERDIVKVGSDTERADGRWTVWSNNMLVREWIKASCVQLEADHLSNELGKQCLKNLLCMAHVAYIHPTVGDIGQHKQDGHDDGSEDLKHIVKDVGIDDDTEKKTGDETSKIGRMLRWVVTRMCGIASKGGQEEHHMLRRGCALRFMMVSVKWWGANIISQFLRLYVFPVVRVLESGQVDQERANDVYYHRGGKYKNKHSSKDRKKSSDNHNDKANGEDDGQQTSGSNMMIGFEAIRMVAENLQSVLIECVGNEEYYKVYHILRARVNTAKVERKRQAAVMLAVDGERVARRKRMKSAKRQGRTFNEEFDADEDGNHDSIEHNRQMKRLLTEGL